MEGPFAWGSANGVTKLRHLYFGGQPDAAGLAAARDQGIAVVINLRAPEELDWDEAATAEALGLAYYNVPIQRQGPFSP